MSTQEVPIASFLKEVMRRRKRLPSQLAAGYSGLPLEKILSIVGHLPRIAEVEHRDWPEFREYARRKYSAELDEDLITMIEDLIERRRGRRYESKDKKGS